LRKTFFVRGVFFSAICLQVKDACIYVSFDFDC
jgi:hypothetical protein